MSAAGGEEAAAKAKFQGERIMYMKYWTGWIRLIVLVILMLAALAVLTASLDAIVNAVIHDAPGAVIIDRAIHAQGRPTQPVPAGERPAYCSPAAPASYYACGYTWEYAGRLQEAGIHGIRRSRRFGPR